MTKTIKILGSAGLGASLLALGICTACSRIAEDPPVDYSVEEERICEEYCFRWYECEDPDPDVFESAEACASHCVETHDMEQDDDCAQNIRDVYQCNIDAKDCEEFAEAQSGWGEVCLDLKLESHELCSDD